MINTDGKPTIANYPLKMGRDVQATSPGPESNHTISAEEAAKLREEIEGKE